MGSRKGVKTRRREVITSARDGLEGKIELSRKKKEKDGELIGKANGETPKHTSGVIPKQPIPAPLSIPKTQFEQR